MCVALLSLLETSANEGYIWNLLRAGPEAVQKWKEPKTNRGTGISTNTLSSVQLFVDTRFWPPPASPGPAQEYKIQTHGAL